MRKFWLVFAYEYRRHVLRKRFIFSVVSIPLLIIILMAVVILMQFMSFNSKPVGYVDLPNLLSNPQQVQPGELKIIPVIQFIAYPDESSARSALDQNKIQAYYVLDQTYMSNGMARLVSAKTPSEKVQSQFREFLTINIMRSLPEDIQQRLMDGFQVETQSMDGSRKMRENDWLSIALPMLAGIMLIIAVNISGGYLLNAVVEEKENRTMEVIVTSVSPDQLMAGKVVGDLCIGLTQLAIWTAVVIGCLFFASRAIPDFPPISLDVKFLLLLAVAFLPAFVMVAGLMGAIGANASDSREAQQVAGIVSLPLMIPLWFVSAIMFNPNSSLSVGLSIFPLTSPVALTLRSVFTTIPAWQMILSIGLLYICAVGALWLAGRVFRLGMLLYNKQLSFRQIFQRKSRMNSHV